MRWQWFPMLLNSEPPGRTMNCWYRDPFHWYDLNSAQSAASGDRRPLRTQTAMSFS